MFSPSLTETFSDCSFTFWVVSAYKNTCLIFWTLFLISDQDPKQMIKGDKLQEGKSLKINSQDAVKNSQKTAKKLRENGYKNSTQNSRSSPAFVVKRGGIQKADRVPIHDLGVVQNGHL